MTPAPAMLHILALAACLAARLAGSGDMEMPGVRRALQTIDAAAAQIAPPQPPAFCLSGR